MADPIPFSLPKATINNIPNDIGGVNIYEPTASPIGDMTNATSGYNLGQAGVTGALDLIEGILMGRYESGLPANRGLDVNAPPPAFDEAAAMAELQSAQQFGSQRGSALGSGIGTGIGALLAPLTGGLSLALGGALGEGIGGMIGGTITGNRAEDLINQRRQSANRIGMAYRDVTSEMGTRSAVSDKRQSDIEALRQAAFGDFNY